MNVNETYSTAQWRSLRRWSAEQLELSAETTAAAARSVALRKLSEWDFAPPDRWQQACELLLAQGQSDETAPALHGRENPLAEVEAQLRQEVVDFSAVYFELPAAPRRDRWSDLRNRCQGFPGLLWAMDRLKAGLDVHPRKAAGTDPSVQALAHEIVSLFVLPPQPQAIRRQTLLAEKAGDVGRWTVAARKLRQEQAELAALAEDYIAALTVWREHQVELTKTREKARKALMAATKRAQKAQLASPKASSGVGVGVMIAIGLVSACVRIMTNNNSSSYRPQPSYQSPAFPTDSQLRRDTQKALRDLIEQSKKKSQSGRTAPAPVIDPWGKEFITPNPDSPEKRPPLDGDQPPPTDGNSPRSSQQTSPERGSFRTPNGGKGKVLTLEELLKLSEHLDAAALEQVSKQIANIVPVNPQAAGAGRLAGPVVMFLGPSSAMVLLPRIGGKQSSPNLLRGK